MRSRWSAKGGRRSIAKRGYAMLHPDRRASDDALDTGLAVRLACRSGCFDGPTSGFAYGYVQGNLAILPRDWAEDFLRFCQANPKPCPLLGVADAGDPRSAVARRRSRHPHRRAALPRVARMASSSRSRRPQSLVARRSGGLRDRLLVLLRGGAAAERRAGAAHRARLQRADVPHHRSRRAAPAGSTGRWWCRCGR